MKRVVLSHPVAIAGAVLASATAVVFIALVIAVAAGMLENPYAGLVVFVLIPTAFVLGLLLVPIGIRLQRRQAMRDPNAVVDWPILDFRQASVRRTALVVAALTGVNIVLVLLAGYGGLHWMESPSFCGQVCHAPMHPQFTAWQNATHARVACVKCHIGEGAAGFAHAKLSGVRQLIHVATGQIPRPITPGASMPPGAQAQTCVACHKPGHISGEQIRVIREYSDDEENSETTTVLQMHVGIASSEGRSIHWHADPASRVEYVATDDSKETIPWVRLTNANGEAKEFVSPDTSAEAISAGTRHMMGCVDCHNTVGHPIAPTPERAVDNAIAAGLISRKLPHSRREAVRLMTAHADAGSDAAQEIAAGLQQFYQAQQTPADQDELKRTVAALQNVYRSNVFPDMKVTWGSYPNNLGHVTSNGCFRCHDDSHKAKDGSTISADCDYCHRQIEQP